MTSLPPFADSRVPRLRPRHLAPLLAVVFLLLGATSAMGISRATVLARAQSWVDTLVPYSQAKYYGGYRTDCSGFCSMTWSTKSRGRPISYSTRSLHLVSHRIARAELMPGDAMLKPNYHVRVFYAWLDASHTKYVAYEQTGPTTKSSIQDFVRDWAQGYKPVRLDSITDGPPPWNSVVNPTIDVWASRVPVWWQPFGGWGSTVCSRSVDVVKSGRNALRLVNISSRSRDVVGVSQTASVTAGAPYTLSVWAATGADPDGLELRLQFLDAAGAVLRTSSTSGAAWSLETTALAKMSLTATAPAQATSATVSVRLEGGVDASGTAGTTAVVDDFRLYDRSPVGSEVSVSGTSTVRGTEVTFSGRVTAPVPYGTVRIYTLRPDRKVPIALLDKKLAGGEWTMKFRPGLRGKYTFTAKYLGYGPFGFATSPAVALRVQ